jgi:hypothetical protein
VGDVRRKSSSPPRLDSLPELLPQWMRLREFVKRVSSLIRQRFNDFQCGLPTLQPAAAPAGFLWCDVPSHAFQNCVMVGAKPDKVQRMIWPFIIVRNHIVQMTTEDQRVVTDQAGAFLLQMNKLSL